MNESFFDNNLEKKDKKLKNNNPLWIIIFVWMLIIVSNIIVFYLVDKCYSIIAVDLLSICFTTLYLRREWKKNNNKTKLTLKVLIKVVITFTVLPLILYLSIITIFCPFAILFILALPFLIAKSFKIVDRFFNISMAKKALKELASLVFLIIIYVTLYIVLVSIFEF